MNFLQSVLWTDPSDARDGTNVGSKLETVLYM